MDRRGSQRAGRGLKATCARSRASDALLGWQSGEPVEASLSAVCIDAQATHGALKHRLSKIYRGTAKSLARLAQTDWFKTVRLKSRATLESGAVDRNLTVVTCLGSGSRRPHEERESRRPIEPHGINRIGRRQPRVPTSP